MALTLATLKNLVKGKATIEAKRQAILDYKISQLGTTATIRSRIAKKAFDLVWQEHSNEHIGNKIIAYANTLPAGALKLKLLIGGQIAANHPQLCYQDFFDFFNYEIPNANGTFGWYPDEEMMIALLDAFVTWPLAKRFFTEKLKQLYPNIEEDKW